MASLFPCQPEGGSLAGEVTRGLSTAGCCHLACEFVAKQLKEPAEQVSVCIPSPGPNSVVIPIGWALQAVAETPYHLRSLVGDYMCVCYEQPTPRAPVEGCDTTWAFQIESWSVHAYSPWSLLAPNCCGCFMSPGQAAPTHLAWNALPASPPSARFVSCP